MTDLRLRFACSLYDRMLPLYLGEVRPDGIDLDFVAIDSPREIFDRMAGGLEFDAAEMSSSEFISRRSAGEKSLVAIPVFPSRVFRHGFIAVGPGIKTPRDLEGKRIGVPLYTMTAAIWIRGHLQHEYGVDLSTVRWVQGSINSAGAHGNPTVLPMAKSVPIEVNDSGRSLSQLLDEGRIDSIIGTSLPEAIRHNPDIGRLFPNFVELEKDYYKRTGIYPIMHLIAIKREIYERYPFVASSLYDAFVESKKIALGKMFSSRALRYMTPWLMRDIDEIHEVFNGEPWPYGIEPNRKTLQALMTYLVDQSLIAKPIPVDDLFVPTYG